MVKYRLSESVLVQKVISETVLLDLHKGTYFELNETGSFMLEHLREHGDPKKVLNLVLQEYDIDAQTLSNDLNHLLDDLQHNGLIESIPD